MNHILKYYINILTEYWHIVFVFALRNAELHIFLMPKGRRVHAELQGERLELLSSAQHGHGTHLSRNDR